YARCPARGRAVSRPQQGRWTVITAIPCGPGIAARSISLSVASMGKAFAPSGVKSLAHRYAVVGLAVTAVLLLVLAAHPSFVPIGTALLIAAAMVGVALAILVLSEGRRRALVSLEIARQRSDASAEAVQAARAEAESAVRRLAFLVDGSEVVSAS